MRTWIEIYIDGELVHRQQCRSFVENLGRILIYSLGANDIPVVRQDGTVENISPLCDIGDTVLRVTAGAGDDSFGIIVGSGTRPVTRKDYALEKKIPHGTGEGQLVYHAVNIGSVFIDENVVRREILRSFTNESGSDVTISEVGLVIYGVGRRPLIERTVLDTPVVVSPGSSVTIKYVIEY